jgi:hypothetical protein
MTTESNNRHSMPVGARGYAWRQDSVLDLPVVVIRRSNKTGGKVSR